ncbi:MAG: ABC transporter permease [Gemmatimonadales bacterium]|nr:ABC transporter permease [Gemmatimonadales bacterium]
MSRAWRWLHGLSVWPMLVKEFIQLRRDRPTVAMMVGIPAIQLMLFGFAIRTEVRNLPTAVYDEARTSDSRALVQTILNTGNFRFHADATSRDEITRWIEAGTVRAAIVIPPEFTRDLAQRRTARVQVIVDASDPLASQAAMSGASLGGQQRALEIATARGGSSLPLEVSVRPLYNPTLQSSTYIVPGIIGVLLSMTLVIVMGMSVVRERERGTLEQLVVTPISRIGLMLGKVLPFVLVGYVQMTVILLLGRVVFHVPLRGSLLLLYVAAAGFIGANLAIGLWLSTMVRTQAQAMQMGFLFLLPNLLLSGFMFPREAMPEGAQWLGAALPLTYFLEVLRGILLKGVGLAALWPQITILAVFAVLFVGLAVRRFHKTVE